MQADWSANASFYSVSAVKQADTGKITTLTMAMHEDSDQSLVSWHTQNVAKIAETPEDVDGTNVCAEKAKRWKWMREVSVPQWKKLLYLTLAAR